MFIHSTIANATPDSPLLSLTELSPEEALKKLPKVATERLYVVRVRVDPKDVGRVNEILAKAGRTANLADELEVVVAKDLTNPQSGARILTVSANPAKGAALGGLVGPGLTWLGRGMMLVSALSTTATVLTAEGPKKHETIGRAFGGFAAGTAGGAFLVGLCIGLGAPTVGVSILLCGVGGGALLGFAGAAAGGAVGRQFD